MSPDADGFVSPDTDWFVSPEADWFVSLDAAAGVGGSLLHIALYAHILIPVLVGCAGPRHIPYHKRTNVLQSPHVGLGPGLPVGTLLCAISRSLDEHL